MTYRKNNLTYHCKASLMTMALAAFMVIGIPSNTAIASSPVVEKLWEGESVEHKNFIDHGNYVIELKEYTDPDVIKKGLAFFNTQADKLKMPKPGCTAMAKINSDGEVVIGRNMDLDVSRSAAYIIKTSFGKYRTVSVVYAPGLYKPYAELKNMEEIEPDFLAALPFMATDNMNEKGLYIEMNLREYNEKLTSYGLHSAHGEKNRQDGVPWSELRACQISAASLIAQNCATVKEAVEYLKNSYDYYTVSNMPGVNGNNMCFLIGDATGEYGVIEMAQDEVKYIPYQFGHANFYITPRWRTLDISGAGEGRLEMVSEVIGDVDTLEEAMDAMKPIMWRYENLWIGETKRVKDEKHPNPYNQIKFVDNQGNRVMDWRAEYDCIWPVLDDGRLLLEKQVYLDAKKSTYDPDILKYLDEALKTKKLVIDDGSIKFRVLGKKYTLSDLLVNEKPEVNTNNPKLKAALKQELRRLRLNQDLRWVNDDYNFEALKAAVYASRHIRYNEDGKFDMNAMSQYEKLKAFYGYGVDKDENPLRNAGDIWTTSLNVGANCAQKEMKVRFWENDEVIFHVKY